METIRSSSYLSTEWVEYAIKASSTAICQTSLKLARYISDNRFFILRYSCLAVSIPCFAFGTLVLCCMGSKGGLVGTVCVVAGYTMFGLSKIANDAYEWRKAKIEALTILLDLVVLCKKLKDMSFSLKDARNKTPACTAFFAQLREIQSMAERWNELKEGKILKRDLRLTCCNTLSLKLILLTGYWREKRLDDPQIETHFARFPTKLDEIFSCLERVSQAISDL